MAKMGYVAANRVFWEAKKSLDSTLKKTYIHFRH